MKFALASLLAFFCACSTAFATSTAAGSLTIGEAVDQPGWNFTTGGHTPWFAQTVESYDGLHAVRSGQITDNQQSWFETTVDGPGLLSFWWKVSSEEYFDFLEFYINGAEQDAISGEQPWSRQSYPLGPGLHTLRWRYIKDFSVKEGQDAGWVDQLSFIPEDDLLVQPADTWNVTGFVGIPLETDRVFTLLNEGTQTIQVSASADANWLTTPGSAVSLPPGASTGVAIHTGPATADLALGVHEAELIFLNTTSGVQHRRPVRLTISPQPGTIEVTDSVAPVDDHSLPFGEISVGTSKRETVRIRNSHGENNLTIERIQLRPTASNTGASVSIASTAFAEEAALEASSASVERASQNLPGNPRHPPASPEPDWTREHDPHTLLVRFKKGTASHDRVAAHHVAGTRVAHAMRRIPLDVIELPQGADPRAVLAQYRKHPFVEYAEPNYIVNIGRQPNDPLFGDLWALENVGQEGGIPGADISALEAWSWTQGSDEIVVAVIDTGIDYTHPDLSPNIWTNPNPTFGDLHGARWTGGTGAVTSGDPMDDNGHGTHVAGTIGAAGDNGIGIVGVNWNVRLMALKFLDASGSGSVADAISALEYAIDHGAHLTNNSWGGGGYSQALKDMIEAAGEANQLFVAAAGNSGSNNDTTPSYPDSYDLDNIISVASSTRTDERSAFSNYGVNTVHLAAPGSSILSTFPGGGYESFSGTSMAAPHVAGVAALLLSLDPTAGYQDIRKAILDGVTPLPQWENLVSSGGRLNAAGALRNLVKEFRLRNVPELPVALTPGRSILLEVIYEPLDVGDHEAILLIDSEDLDTPSIEVLLTGSGRADALEIVQTQEFEFEGYFGGPFSPATASYTLRNNGSTPLSWEAGASASWIAVAPVSGSVPAGSQTTVTVSLGAEADLLPGDLYRETISFSNRSSGLTQTRPVTLDVWPWPGTLLVTDSAPPEEDLQIPFGQTEPGESKTETVVLHNTHPDNNLIIEDIQLLGGYREDFDRSYLLGWDSRPAEAWAPVNNTAYRALLPQQARFMQSTHVEELWYDGRFEARMRRSGNITATAALILRASPDFDIDSRQGNAIVVGISGNGSYFVARFFRGNLHWHQPWTSSSFLNTGQTANVLVANLAGDQLHLFANNHLLWSGNVGGIYQPGLFGVAGYTGPESTTHFFDYIDIREPIETGLLPLTALQAWHNADPAKLDESHAFHHPPANTPKPPEKALQAELFSYETLLARTETFQLPDLPAMPVQIAPGESLSLPVQFSPVGESDFARTLRIFSNDPDRPTVDLTLSGASEKDPMHVFPRTASFVFAGELFHQTSPSSIEFGIFNSGTSPIDLQVTSIPPWLSITSTAATLPPASTIHLEISPETLPRGRHTGSIEITNTNTGFVRSISVEVEIRPALCEALKECQLTWTTGGDAPWFGQEAITFRNDTAAQSGAIGDDEESWVETTVTGPGEISFWWMVSSEPGYDFLEFQVNGAPNAAVSGEVPWQKRTVKLPEGQQTLRWVYKKDFIVSEGHDTAWLDEVVWTPTPPQRVLTTDPAVNFGVVEVGQSTSRIVAVTNTGDSTLFISSVSVPDHFTRSWNIATIAPGESRNLTVTFSPSNAGDHQGAIQFTSNATGGTSQIQVAGSAVAPDGSTELQHGQVISGLTSSQDGTIHFWIDVPENRSWLEVRIFGGSGDADLYVRHGSRPTLLQWDYAPYETGNNETVLIDTPQAGMWHFMVHGYEDFSDLSIVATFAQVTFESWAVTLDLPTGSRGMLDRHGPMNITNLQAYAFGRDPRLLTSNDLPRIARSASEPGTVKLVYRMRVDATNFSLQIETSDDLSQWKSAAPLTDNVLSESDGVQTREATFETEEGRPLFLRTSVTYHAP